MPNSGWETFGLPSNAEPLLRQVSEDVTQEAQKRAASSTPNPPPTPLNWPSETHIDEPGYGHGV